MITSGCMMFANKQVETFSRGMKQRLGLAEILMKEAQIAILDEPTSGLDPQATLELLDIIRNLKNQGVEVCSCPRICSTACRAFATGWRCSAGATSSSWALSPNSAGRCWAAATTSRWKRKAQVLVSTCGTSRA